MVYNFCTNHFAGDDYKRIWNKKKFKPPYKGVSKLEKRLSANLDLIEKFNKICSEKKIRFIVMYGQTEASPRMSYVPWDFASKKIGSIGMSKSILDLQLILQSNSS